MQKRDLPGGGLARRSAREMEARQERQERTMTGELRYNQQSGCYEGEAEGGERWLSVPKNAIDLARHQALLCGDPDEDLMQVETWIERPKLLTLEGVKLKDAQCRLVVSCRSAIVRTPLLAGQRLKRGSRSIWTH